MALSKPWPDGGNPPKSAQVEPAGTVPSFHGAKAGLSVLTVSVPAVLVFRFAAWHSGLIDAAATCDAPAEGPLEAGADDGEAGATELGGFDPVAADAVGDDGDEARFDAGALDGDDGALDSAAAEGSDDATGRLAGASE